MEVQRMGEMPTRERLFERNANQPHRRDNLATPRQTASQEVRQQSKRRASSLKSLDSSYHG